MSSNKNILTKEDLDQMSYSKIMELNMTYLKPRKGTSRKKEDIIN